MLRLSDVHAGSVNLNFTSPAANLNVPINQLFLVDFTSPLDTSSAIKGIGISKDGVSVPTKLSFWNDYRSVSLGTLQDLINNQSYQLVISDDVKGRNGEAFAGISIGFTTIPAVLSVESFKIDGVNVTTQNQITDVSLNPTFEFNFTFPLDVQTAVAANFMVSSGAGPLVLSLSNQNKTVTLLTSNKLDHLNKYSISVSSLKGSGGETFSSYTKNFYTQVDNSPKFPVVTDDELLTIVEQQTLKYFYDFGHPASGMARERDTSGDVVTTGGSGFGLMGMIAGIERGFISRTDGITRFNKIISFLETADRFHGVWPHWMNGNTGKVVPFASNDDGADIVETAYMVQGLITVRQYLSATDTVGNNLINRINKLWQGVEWDWFRQNGQNVLYWNWSPDHGWAVNVPVRGYNETLITYVLSAGSPSHSISADVYQQGWAQNGTIKNGNNFFGHLLPLGEDYGGPLFFTQYSFLGLTPHLHDSFLNVDYWTQNVNQALINHDYCLLNPKKFVSYTDSCWGLTASDNPTGYGAQSPTNDNGTITPTAAVSSMPYTPVESMNAIKFFYFSLGDKLWGPYGFYDAINVTNGWTATSTLAIDQGPMIVMIENYRTQLLWNLFMSAPEVQAGLGKLGFTF